GPRVSQSRGRSVGDSFSSAKRMRDGSSPGSLALGAPLGTALYSAGGFAGVAIAATLMPFLAVLFVAPLLPVPPQQHARSSLRTVAAAVWLPGLGAALNSRMVTETVGTPAK